jgi:hypothetical protein
MSFSLLSLKRSTVSTTSRYLRQQQQQQQQQQCQTPGLIKIVHQSPAAQIQHQLLTFKHHSQTINT